MEDGGRGPLIDHADRVGCHRQGRRHSNIKGHRTTSPTTSEAVPSGNGLNITGSAPTSAAPTTGRDRCAGAGSPTPTLPQKGEFVGDLFDEPVEGPELAGVVGLCYFDEVGHLYRFERGTASSLM